MICREGISFLVVWSSVDSPDQTHRVVVGQHQKEHLSSHRHRGVVWVQAWFGLVCFAACEGGGGVGNLVCCHGQELWRATLERH